MSDKEKIKAAVSKLRRKDPRVIAIRNMIALAKVKRIPGDNGKDGIDGATGADGINGIDGLRGADLRQRNHVANGNHSRIFSPQLGHGRLDLFLVAHASSPSASVSIVTISSSDCVRSFIASSSACSASILGC